jgi:hypothetical protein
VVEYAGAVIFQRQTHLAFLLPAPVHMV